MDEKDLQKEVQSAAKDGMNGKERLIKDLQKEPQSQERDEMIERAKKGYYFAEQSRATLGLFLTPT